MFRAAITFFVIGLVAMFFGLYNIAGVSMELGRVLLGLFLVLAIVSYIISLVNGGGRKILP